MPRSLALMAWCGIALFSFGISLKAAEQLRIVPLVRDDKVLVTFELADGFTDEVKAAIILFYSMLDERQRRVYAGLESLKLGHGGDRQLGEWLDLGPHTVAQGRRELLEAASLTPTAYRVRRPGGGRPTLEKKRHRSSPPSNS